MNTSEQINELAAALSKAQGEMGDALKGSDNPFFKSRYADLAAVWEACRAPLAKHEIAIVQSPSTDGARVSVDTFLIHRSGQWMRGTISVSAHDDSAQAVGSAVTYCRRYALQAFAGVAPADDDGEAAHGRGGNNNNHHTPTGQREIPNRTVEVARPAAPLVDHLAWVDTLRAIAPDGTKALHRAWYAGPAGYQKQLLTEAPELWETLQAIAALKGAA